ncbi:MAG: cytochrome oxidase subunit III [Bacteroidetes bacterium]|nr:MAG: cytochrome oxidase subunit III [Bacteroidota bacterium]
MKSKTAPINTAPEMLAMHPQKFALWIGIVSIVMLFAAFTSAYIVRQGEGNWLMFELPTALWYSTVLILLSSASMHWSYLMAKADKQDMLRIAVSLTVVLGGAFLYTQVYAWAQLVEAKVFFAGTQSNPSGSFLYVLTGMHAIHLVSGLLFLAVVFVSAFLGKIHSKNLTRIEMCATYWHFLDALWVYLFVFLLLNN